jgi:predicted CopG family antitoxin
MATKTISIDLEAYNRLKRHKGKTESFSDVIKRVVRPPFDVKKWLADIRKNPVSEELADAVLEHVEERRRAVDARARPGKLAS